MSAGTSKASYKRHAYSGPRKNIKRIRGGLRGYYHDVESRLKAWRSEETKKPVKEAIVTDNSIIAPSTSTATAEPVVESSEINWPRADPEYDKDNNSNVRAEMDTCEDEFVITKNEYLTSADAYKPREVILITKEEFNKEEPVVSEWAVRRPSEYNSSTESSLSYICDLCQRNFKKKIHLDLHKRTHTGEKPYACDLCNKNYYSKNALVLHVRTHTVEKPYACDLCQKKFRRKFNLVVHSRTHTGEKPYACDLCQKKFSEKAYMVIHKRTHTGEKPYACDLCQSKFSRKSSMIEHKRTHTGEKPYACDLCQRRFRHKTTMVVHSRTHTGEKPYTCDKCDQKYSSKRALRNHVNSHTFERLYTCDVCTKTYSRKGSFYVHMKTHNIGKPYACHICNKKFSVNSALFKHKRTHTEERPLPLPIQSAVLQAHATAGTVSYENIPRLEDTDVHGNGHTVDELVTSVKHEHVTSEEEDTSEEYINIQEEFVKEEPVVTPVDSVFTVEQPNKSSYRYLLE